MTRMVALYMSHMTKYHCDWSAETPLFHLFYAEKSNTFHFPSQFYFQYIQYSWFYENSAKVAQKFTS